MTMRQALDEIRSSIGRGKGTFAVSRMPAGQGKPFSLSVGSIRVVRVDGGFVISLGLSRDQVAKLRAMCDEMLAEEPASVKESG